MAYSLQLTFILVVQWSLNTDALRCLSCTGTLHPWLCTVARTCSHHENACGIKKYNTLNGETLYDVGCTIESLCGSDGGKRTLFDYHPHGNESQTICRECCYGEFCNSHGCGSYVGIRMMMANVEDGCGSITEYTYVRPKLKAKVMKNISRAEYIATGYPTDRGPVCFSCARIKDPARCSTLAFCSESEVCTVFEEQVFDKVFSSSRCTASLECEQPAAGVFGKRQSHEGLCATCCNSDFCNDRCQGINSATSTTVTTPASNSDLEFLLMYPYLVDTYDMYIVMLAESAGTAQLEVPYLHMMKTITLKPGLNNFTLIKKMKTEPGFVKTKKGIYLKSSVALTVWVIFGKAPGDSSDNVGYSVLAVEKLDKHYKLSNIDAYDQVTIGALSDNTTVKIQCLQHQQLNISGNVCSFTSNVTLHMNRLETISFYSVTLAGISIFSDKNVSVITGNPQSYDGSYYFNIKNSSVRFSSSAEYLPPIRMSDTTFLLPIFPESSIDTFYVTPFGKTANPTIYFTDTTGTRRRCSGNIYRINDFYLDAGPLYIESIQPILLSVKPSERQAYKFKLGDYSWIPSISQYRNKYLITNVDSIIPGNFSQTVSIILLADQLDGFLIDGSRARPPTDLSYLTVKQVRYVFMLLSLNGPFHVIEHSNRSVTFGAFVIGKSDTRGFGGSYIFPAGVN